MARFWLFPPPSLPPSPSWCRAISPMAAEAPWAAPGRRCCPLTPVLPRRDEEGAGASPSPPKPCPRRWEQQAGDFPSPGGGGQLLPPSLQHPRGWLPRACAAEGAGEGGERLEGCGNQPAMGERKAFRQPGDGSGSFTLGAEEEPWQWDVRCGSRSEDPSPHFWHLLCSASSAPMASAWWGDRATST